MLMLKWNSPKCNSVLLIVGHQLGQLETVEMETGNGIGNGIGKLKWSMMRMYIRVTPLNND